jgi:outer membrane protein
MKKTLVCLVAMLLVSGMAFAQDSSWMLRVRGISIQPNESSDQIPSTGGTEVGVDSAIVPEVDLTYQWNEKWGIELVAAIAEHDLQTEGGAASGVDTGSATLIPPTLSLQYFFGEKIRPYIGAGINFTTLSYDLPDDGNPADDIRALGVTDVDLDSSFGFSVGGGIDFMIGERWLINADVKYITLSTDATVEGGVLDGTKVGIDIDPLVFGAGAGFRW